MEQPSPGRAIDATTGVPGPAKPDRTLTIARNEARGKGWRNRAIADVAGIAVPDAVDGRSLRAPGRRNAILPEGWSKKSGSPNFAGVRIMDALSQDALYWERRGGKRYFFDRTDDPGARNNLVRDAAYASQVEAARDLVAALQQCRGPACRTAEDGAASPHASDPRPEHAKSGARSRQHRASQTQRRR
jgi:hypothetical protein